MATQSIARPIHPEPPLAMFRPLTQDTLAPVVQALVDAAQAIDPSSDPVPFECWPGYLQARVHFIARGATRSCFESVLHDGELRARGSVAEVLFGRHFDRLSPREQAKVFEVTKAAVNARQRHIEGICGELLPSERAALKVPGEL